MNSDRTKLDPADASDMCYDEVQCMDTMYDLLWRTVHLDCAATETCPICMEKPDITCRRGRWKLDICILPCTSEAKPHWVCSLCCRTLLKRLRNRGSGECYWLIQCPICRQGHVLPETALDLVTRGSMEFPLILDSEAAEGIPEGRPTSVIVRTRDDLVATLVVPDKTLARMKRCSRKLWKRLLGTESPKYCFPLMDKTSTEGLQKNWGTARPVDVDNVVRDAVRHITDVRALADAQPIDLRRAHGRLPIPRNVRAESFIDLDERLRTQRNRLRTQRNRLDLGREVDCVQRLIDDFMSSYFVF